MQFPFETTTGRASTLCLVLAFGGTIPLATWMIGNFGDCAGNVCTVQVAPGIAAPSGVLVVGLALVLRDAIYESAGMRGVAAAVLMGAAVTLAVAPASLAVASLAAFLVAEAVDTWAYSSTRSWGRPAAVLLSGLAGAAADSAAFLSLAFGSLDYFPGQTLGKLYASVAAAVFLAWRRQ